MKKAELIKHIPVSISLFLIPLFNISHSLFINANQQTDQKFTIVFLPDTQFYSEIDSNGNSSSTGGNIAMFDAQTKWIAANRATKNIVYVGQLGDCVQNGDKPPVLQKNAEWIKASKAFANLDDPAITGLPQGIPYGICVGNHDQTPGGDPSGTTTFYNQYFGIDHFKEKKYYGGHYGSNNDNHYELFSAGGLDFLVISFEYDQTPNFSAKGNALDWAENLVRKYNNRKVIVMTHYGMNETQPDFSIQGRAIYDRLKFYPNFILFACGHICHTDGEERRTDTFNGNTVHTLLSDYQCRQNGGNGLLRIMEFDPSKNKIYVKTYSPYTGIYEKDEDSQFELNVQLTK